MNRTTVYWAYASENNLSNVSGFPPEKLIHSLKNDDLWSGTSHGDILKCPCSLDAIKNTYVIRSSINAHYWVEGDAIVSDYRGIIGHVDEYLQMHDVNGFLFYSENSVNITVTPPYYHPECRSGVSGNYDISKWFRPIGPSVSMRMQPTFDVMHGQPLMYVSFDRSVNLVQFEPTKEVLQIAEKSASLKSNMNKTPLSKLYAMFARNKLGKLIGREIKRSVL